MTCQNPEKQAHPSRRAALKARESLETGQGIDLALRPYPCDGHWHLGHRAKSSGRYSRLARELHRRAS